MELWDAFDADYGKIEGMTLVRGEKVPDGVYHMVCSILVRHTDGTYLIMQRHPDKHFGGLWEATAGGAAIMGETPLMCAKRELYEETGIVSDNLLTIGREASEAKRTHYYCFLCETDTDKNAVTLQPGETVAFRWLTEDELLHTELASRAILKHAGIE